MASQKRSILRIATPLQKKLMIPIFLAILMPTAIVSFCLYMLVSLMLSSPRLSAGEDLSLLINMDFWLLIVLFALPLSIILVWFIALMVTNKIVGPIERVTTEIKSRLQGTKNGPIVLRPGDQLNDLMEQINLLLEKCK